MKYLKICSFLSLFLISVNGLKCSFTPVVYPARVGTQCDTDLPLLDKKLMGTLDDIQQKLPVQQEYCDCTDAYKKGHTTSGVYTINPDNQKCFQVYCDMDTDGGGWTVFQRRIDGSVNFFLNWADYEEGFGDLTGEYWLGLRDIHRLTASGPQELRVELEDYENETRYAHYNNFSVAGADDNYRLTVSGYSGTAGDSLTQHSGHQFTTKDRNNDIDPNNCAEHWMSGGWWYHACHDSNLNGRYGSTSFSQGINWYAWKPWTYSLKATEMKIKRI